MNRCITDVQQVSNRGVHNGL